MLSYFQTHFLMLRMLFVASSIFYLIFSLQSSPILIDLVIFNSIFLFINISSSIPLFLKLIPPKLNHELQDIYSSYFKKYMSKNEFRFLFKHASRRTYRVTSTLIKPGNGFSNFIFIPRIPDNCKITVSTREEYEQRNFSWVGIIEFLELISSQGGLSKELLDSSNPVWKAKFKIEFSNINKGVQSIHEQDSDEESEEKQPELGKSEDMLNSLRLYEFDLYKLNEVFNNPDMGNSIMKALYSIWLLNCSYIVKQKNIKGFSTSKER